MNAGIWRIATAKLCAACVERLEREYIFQP